jgi:two-component system chemotaxis sensor kinase CheA
MLNLLLPHLLLASLRSVARVQRRLVHREGSVSDWWQHKSTLRSLLRSEEDDIPEDVKLEAVELLESLTLWYAERSGMPPQDGEIPLDQVNDVFRTLHTLKGLCMMGNLSELGEIVHHIEDRISAVREGSEKFDQQVFDQLGDILKIFEQFFACYPEPIPAAVMASIAEHNSIYSKSSDSEARVGSAHPESDGTLVDDLGIDPMELDSDLESPEPRPSVAAGVGETSGTSASVEPEASDSDDSAETDLTPTDEESRKFGEFCGRSENLLAAVYPGDRAEVRANEGYENLTRVVEIIYERSAPQVGTLVVFASDLDAEMAGSLGQVDVTELERVDLAMAVFPEPWCFVAFDSASASGEPPISDDFPATEPVIDPVPQAKREPVSAAPAESKSSMASEAEPASSSAKDLPFEDFDSTNQSANQAAMELDQEMLDDFLTNADELIEELSQSMLDLEGDPDNMEAVDTIFRAAHTIKGTAGMFGFRAIEKLTHVMENTFDRIRKGELKASSALMDGLLQALDRIRACFEALKEGKSGELSINAALNHVLQADYAAQHGIQLEKKPSGKPIAGAVSDGGGLVSGQQAAQAAVPAKKAEDESAGAEPAKRAPQGEKPAAGSKKRKDEGVGTIRVDLKRLDALVNLVGELVIDRTRFARIEETLRMSGQNSELLHTMSETLLLFGRHMNDVQSIIMKIRMVPVGNAFYKFTRVVRDLARTCGKEIDLHIEGGETELDKTLVEEIGDPLVHIIRNSADHGIESPEERIALGKNPRGTITLRAYQDGNMIVIFIADDGKGLQPERIRNKAIANGLIAETDQLTEREIFNLIFEPGFSTAEKVTNISGRGVGMDAVKKSIVKLKGVVDVDSTPGSGTQISIKLPLTLAIIPSLLVESCKETYAIPLVNVIESIRISPEEIQRIGHSDFVKLRERVLPLLKLADVFALQSLEERMWYSLPSSDENEDDGRSHFDLLELDPSKPEPDASDQSPVSSSSTLGPHTSHARSLAPSSHHGMKSRRSKQPRLIFVVVGVGEQRVGFIVDQLMGQQEIVIKSLGRILGRSRGVSGGCVLGNGRVALVLDVGELIEDHSESGRGGGHRVAS